MDIDNSFNGEIVVGSRIIDYLSSGLYPSPAACLKELINNSFDADATIVNVYVKPDADRIIIEDNGTGMNRTEFETNLKKISESHKRDDGNYTFARRPKIGKIGIGFIAANEICEVMHIISHKEGSPEQLEVSINFDLMRQAIATRKRTGDDIAKGHYEGKVLYSNEKTSFTQIILEQIRGEARKIFAGAGTSSFSVGTRNLYGLKPESELKILKDKSLKTWLEFDAYSQNRLEVALSVPVPYHDNWLPENLEPQVKFVEKQAEDLNFHVYFDGSELRKPIAFNPVGRALISEFNFVGKKVSATGYFYAQNSSIQPDQLHGLLIHIRNAAVGGYDTGFLNFSLTYGPLFQKWISAEVYADDRLEDAMNIDRRTLRTSHPAYTELQAAIHDHLQSLIKRMRSEIYGAGSDDRNILRAEKSKNKILKIISKEISRVSPEAAQRMKRAWSVASDNNLDRKRLLKKYSVDEVYSIVLNVASEVLTEKQYQEFVDKLTIRLRK